MTMHIRTDDAEQIARALFGSALPRLSRVWPKRRAQLGKEFRAAHLNLPGLSSRDESAFAKLTPPIKAIANARQARVDAWLGQLPERVTLQSTREKLTKALGESALRENILHAKRQVAVALTLIAQLEGEHADVPGDLSAGADKLAGKLEAAGLREKVLGREGLFSVGRGLELLSALADAVCDDQLPVAKCDQLVTSERQAAAPNKTTPAPRAEMGIAEFNALAPAARMNFILGGGKLAD